MSATSQEMILKLKMISDVSDVTSNTQQIQQALNKLDVPKELKQKFTNIFSDLEKETKNYQNLLNSGFKGKKDVTGLEASGKRINTLMKQLESSMKGIDPSILERSFKIDPAQITKMNAEMDGLKGRLNEILSSQAFQDLANDANTAAEAMQKVSKSKFTGNFLEAVKKGDIEGAANALKLLEENHKKFKEDTKNADYEKAFGGLQAILGRLKGNTALQETSLQISQLTSNMANLHTTELDKFVQNFQNGQSAVGNMTQQVREFTKANNESAAAQQRTNSEIDQIKSRITYFFSLTNSVQLFRRALNTAIKTVKELDATMTEAAVVTDFSVGDMWNRLPEYAAQAQKLGVSINSMYQATTLYYQQGLKNNQAMQLGVETMKMAKIAGLESEDATKAMTAALRGFNMELNQISATKVNDVYSQLAAITAADVGQISTAMEKTASIAANANMELETTAAFLAQIIETTQEAPETAGTAMKTIIARFSEVKNLRSQGQATGEDSEGEAIDVNKIQTALATVGISMNDYFAGAEGLDSILLKLAEKWNTLDFETQRYIATMAAGSRQQSRFIAMMSDYGRTTELVEAAQNSAGASQKQFEKTMESLEYKLQKLSNAWQTFLMNISNNTVIKFAVDALTTILNGVNDLINKLSGGSGLIKSILSLGVAIGTLALGKSVFNSLMASIGTTVATGLANAGFIQKAAETGTKAGGAITKAYAASVKANEPMIIGTYNSLFLKLTASTPPITIGVNTTTAQIQTDAFRADLIMLREQLDLVGWEESQVTVASQMLAESYGFAGGALDHLNREEREALMTGLLKQEVTEETLALMGPEVAAIYAKAKASGDEAGATMLAAQAEQTKKNLEMGGIPRLLTLIGLTVTKTTATKAEIGVNWTLIAQLKQEIALWLAKNAYMIAGIAVVLAYVAAIALLITGIVKWVQAAKDAENANEKALAESRNRIKELANQAKATKEAIGAIADERKGLDELNKTFSGLTKGTTEWKEKLVEINSQVLDLINKYPVLAQYIERTADGQLQIGNAGWNALNEDMTQQYQNALTNQHGAQLQQTKIQEQVDIEKANSQRELAYARDEFLKSKEGKAAIMTTTGGVGAIAGTVLGVGASASIAAGVATKIGGAIGTAIAPGIGTAIGALGGLAIGAVAGAIVGHIGAEGADLLSSENDILKQETGMDKETYLKFAAAAQEQGLTWAGGSSKQDYKALFDQMGLGDQGYNFEKLYGNISELGTRFDELSASVYGLQIQQDAYTKSFIASAAENAGDIKNSAEVQNIVSYETGDLSGQIDAKAKEYAENKEYIKDGEAQDKLIEEYAAYMNMTTDQVRAQLEDQSLSAETMANALATQEVQNEVVTKLKEVSKSLERAIAMLPKDKRESYKRLVSEDGSKIVRGDLEEYKKVLAANPNKATTEEGRKEIVDQVLKNMYGKTSAELDIDPNVLWDNFTMSTESFKVFDELAKKYSVSGFENVDAGSAKLIANKVQEQLNNGADAEGATRVMNEVNSLIKGMSNEDASQFITAFTGMDWSNTDSIEGFSKTLEGLGPNFQEAAKKVEGLEDQLKEFANSQYNLTQEEKSELLGQKNELIKKIRGGQTEFTKEELSSFTADMQGKFVDVGGGRYVLADDKITSQDLIDDINKNAKAKTAENDGVTAYQNYKRLSGKTTTYKTKTFDFGYAGITNELIEKYGDYRSANAEGELEAMRTEEGWERGKDFVLRQDGWQRNLYTKYVNPNVTDENIEEEMRAFLTSLSPEAYDAWLMASAAEYDGVDLEKLFAGQDIKAIFGSANRFGKDSTGETKSTWELLGELQNSTFEYEVVGTTRTSDDVISDSTVNALYKQVFPDGDKTSAKDQVEALKEYYNTQKGTMDNQSVEEFVTHYLGTDLDTVLADTKHEYDKQAQGAQVALDALAAATPGVNTQVEGWKNNNKELSNYTNTLTVLALKQNDAIEGVKTLSQVLEDNFDVLKQGPKAGQAYYTALENMQSAIGMAFNIKLDVQSTEKLIPYFDIIREGGDDATLALQRVTEAFIELKASQLAPTNKNNVMNAYQDLQKKLVSGQPIDYDEFLSQYDALTQAQLTQILKSSPWFQMAGSGDEQFIKALDTNSLLENLGMKNDEWVNPYDRFYNTLERINAQLRIRERLEKQYQRLLKNQDSSVTDISKNTEKQLASLTAQKAQQQYLAEGKGSEIDALLRANSKYSKYIKGYDHETGQIQIDWAAIEEIKGTTTGQAVENLISKLEELRDQEQDAIDATNDLEDEISDTKDIGKNEYLDLENRIKDALLYERQEEIDALRAINDSINDTNSAIIDAMQKQLDEERRARDNQKTEEDIAEKQRRLVYLQQDSSGANALDILKLQEEIDQAQEDYTDTLIDQKISALQEQNEKAAEQRERQIAVLEEQKAVYESSGEVWKNVRELWAKGVDDNGLIIESDLMAVLQGAEGWKSMSTQQKEDWANDLYTNAKAAASWEDLKNKLANGDTTLEEAMKTAATEAVAGLKDKENVEKGSYVTEVKLDLNLNLDLAINGLKLDSTQPNATPYVAPTGTVGFTGGGGGYKMKDDNLIKTKFATGGLADFTGPAWLDGTKSRPEYVLNADQTQAFFDFVDVLGALKTGGSKTTQNNGDNTFDIDITVEKIDGDYDVEQMAEKIKTLIVDSSRYRTNNIL